MFLMFLMFHRYSARDPAEIPWGECGADYVCESTGCVLSISDYSV